MSAVGHLLLTLAEREEAGDGYRAHDAGRARSDNPHRIGSHAFGAWHVGWDMARDDAQGDPS